MRIIPLFFISLLSLPALAQQAPQSASSTIEVFRIAPGKHEEFLKFIAKADAVNVSVGLPPRQLYVHSEGASWDYLFIQPSETPTEKLPALEKAWVAAGLPKGANFFFLLRQFVAEHEDTTTKGPTTASAFLADRN